MMNFPQWNPPPKKCLNITTKRSVEASAFLFLFYYLIIQLFSVNVIIQLSGLRSTTITLQTKQKKGVIIEGKLLQPFQPYIPKTILYNHGSLLVLLSGRAGFGSFVILHFLHSKMDKAVLQCSQTVFTYISETISKCSWVMKWWL